MAGAGFKDFAVGEVLTASDVDTYLMQQTVMRFADAAARGSALGTATGAGTALAEGMVSYLDDINVVQVYDGSGWTSPLPGIGTNVAQTVKTDTFTTASSTFGDVTGLAVSITPTSSSSKILVVAHIGTLGADDQDAAGLRILRGSTFINPPTGGSFNAHMQVQIRDTTGGRSEGSAPASMMILDSPNTTSSTTYKVQMAASAGTAMLNRTKTSANSTSISSLTVIEVAA